MRTKTKNRERTHIMKPSHVIAGVVFLLVGVATTACNKKTEQTNSTQPKQTEPSVPWYGGDRIRKWAEPVQLTSVKDFAKVIKLKWDAEFQVYTEEAPDKVITLSSCEDYLTRATVRLWTVKDYENGVFMNRAMMCRATQIMLTGTKPEKTYLQGLQFDKSLPGKLPVNLAMVTVISERSEIARIKGDKSLKLWRDVENITKVEVLGPWHAIYHDEGGMQELELVAKGDFNGDKIEDMLITSRDSVVGGSHKAVRLFLITKLSETGEVVLLNEYGY